MKHAPFTKLLLTLVLLMVVSFSFALNDIEDELEPFAPVPPPSDCLVVGTEIMLSQGQLVNIEDVNEAHTLMAAYTQDDVSFASTGNATFHSLSTNSIVLTSQNSAAGKAVYELTDSFGNVLAGTGGHVVITANRGPVVLAALQLDDRLVTPTGESHVVNVELVDYEGDVHNLLIGNTQPFNPEEDFMQQSFFANNILVGDIKLQRTFN